MLCKTNMFFLYNSAMNKKLKFLLLQILFLFFAIVSLLLGTLFFLGHSININFETSLINNSLIPKIHITSMLPKLKDKSITLTNLEEVTILESAGRKQHYSLVFKFKDAEDDNAEEIKQLQSMPPLPTQKDTYEEAKKLQDKITDALQNNKVVKYEIFPDNNIFSHLYPLWFFVFMFFLFMFFFFMTIKKAVSSTTKQKRICYKR